MTPSEKNSIARMRKEGYGYSRIAQVLGLNQNTVKSYCRRMNDEPKPDGTGCLCCGKAITQQPNRKLKKFCSDVCRMKWWNAHPDKVNRKANYEITCRNCGTAFTSYGNSVRKYCCHECYVEDRFGGGRHE